MKRTIPVILLIFLQFFCKAQSLPEFPAEEGIVCGTLPCGASYYLIHNDCAKGYAEYALVQKNYQNKSESRMSLAEGRDFANEPYAFFASKGVRYDRRGFVYYPEKSTVYRFRNVPAYDAATGDSTLLVIFDLMRHCPSEQAVMISGDVDVRTVADRLHVLSLTVGKLSPAPEGTPYQWSPDPQLKVVTKLSSSAHTGQITLRISTPRTPADKMNTALPLVTRMYARELGIILQSRVRRAFYNAGIPLADISSIYKESSMGATDEKFIFTLHTHSDRLLDAAELLALVVGKLDREGASEDEYNYAKRTCLYELGEKRLRDGNTVYVSKFIRNYLYGGSLSADKVYFDFVSSKNLPSNVALTLFNNYVSALLDSEKSTELEISRPGLPVNEVDCRARFAKGWDKSRSDTVRYVSCRADTLNLYQPKSRVKIKSASILPDGSLWLLSNGVKVKFIKDKDAKKLSVAALFRGGSTLVPSVKSGEAGFLSDMPGLYKVAGIEALDFSEMLRSNGITLESRISPADFRITGRVPKGKLPLFLSSLASFVCMRVVDQAAFDYYKDCEELRLDMRRHSLAYLNDLAENSYRESYLYKDCREIDALGDDLPARTEQFIAAEFAKACDGMIVIVGNIEEAELQKLLCRYLSVFKYSEKIVPRPKLKDAELHGWHTVCRDANSLGLPPSVKMVLSANVPYTKESEMCLCVARMCLAREITARLSKLGYYADVRETIDLYPSERCRIEISAAPALEEGLPAGIRPQSAKLVLQSMREAVRFVEEGNFSAKDIEAFKQTVLNSQISNTQQPDNIVNAVIARAVYGKNLISGIKEGAAAINADKVRSMLRSLDEGARVEVIVK